ncbi:MAG: DUF4430 domain-containing protein [Oscillospiraceae bacterium]|nr:DUF4430 domain-containing protein [Oscillospiraceae bacterium]
MSGKMPNPAGPATSGATGRPSRRGGWMVLLLFMLVAALLSAIWQYNRPQTSQGSKQITLEVDYGSGRQEQFNVRTDASYLKEAAESVLELDGEASSYGFALYSVNGVQADFTTGSQYWAIYVNGQYGQYAIDQQPVADGDHFRLALESYEDNTTTA